MSYLSPRYRPPLTRATKSKERARREAQRVGRKVLWKDKKGYWRAAVDRANTPYYATETEDI